MLQCNQVTVLLCPLSTQLGFRTCLLFVEMGRLKTLFTPEGASTSFNVRHPTIGLLGVGVVNAH